MAGAFRRRLWENDAVLQPAYDLAGEYLLQRHPSTRRALSEMASATGCDAVIPDSKMTFSVSRRQWTKSGVTGQAPRGPVNAVAVRTPDDKAGGVVYSQARQ